MIDNISLSIDIGETISLPKTSDILILGNLEFIGCPNGRDLKSYRYAAQEKNIKFTLTNRTLRISNSLHKFITGENYSDFNFFLLKKAIEGIEYLTQKASNKIEIHTCELALNIETELPGKEYLDKFSMYNFKEFDKMKKGSVIYGIKYILSEYSIKIYDKREHYKLQYCKDIDINMLRFEIEYTKGRRLKGLNYLSDFLDAKKIRIAFADYFNILKKLRCTFPTDLSVLNEKERLLYYAGQSPSYWKTEKKCNKEATKYKKKLYKKVIDKANEIDLMPTFMHSLTLKLELSLNN